MTSLGLKLAAPSLSYEASRQANSGLRRTTQLRNPYSIYNRDDSKLLDY